MAGKKKVVKTAHAYQVISVLKNPENVRAIMPEPTGGISKILSAQQVIRFTSTVRVPRKTMDTFKADMQRYSIAPSEITVKYLGKKKAKA